MQLPEHITENFRSQVFRVLLISVAALLMLFSGVLALVEFSVAHALVLLISIGAASLFGHYNTQLPRTDALFQPKIVFALWGAMWMGIGGGILVAAAASIASARFADNDRKRATSSVSIDIFGAAGALLAFNATVGVLSTFPSWAAVIVAVSVMSAVHFTVRSLLLNIFPSAISARAAEQEWKGLKPENYAAAAIIAMAFYGVLRHFGIELGLIILPLVFAAKLAYNIHLRALDQKTREIFEASRLHLATVEALATAIDARDQVGVGHVRRTQIYAVGMGRLLGLSEGEIDALRTGALLHDIGKLAVPDHILNKPGSLTPAEMEKMKTHSQIGASILDQVGFPYPVVPAVKHHHEMWNGAGYPDGLKGNTIPLTARILSIADAFDALRGARPFRPAVSRDEACEFLRSRAGVQFDPQLAELFLRNLRRFEEEIAAEGLDYQESDVHTTGGRLLFESAGPNYVEQIKSANREVFTLYSLAREFSTSLDLNETLTSFTGKVGEMIPFETCVVYLLDDTGESATAALASGRHADLLKKKRVMVGEGATGYALKKRSSVGNVDPALDFAFSHLDFADEYSAMVAVPLVADDQLVGAVSLYSSTVPHYQDEHIRLLETLARIAAAAIKSALKHAETRSHALTDPMTGLPNSRSLQIEFDKEVTRASRTGSNFQLMVLDLDGFKSVNDTYGHLVGDTMLKSIGQVIQSELREYDFLARYGGDEFVAIIPETDSDGVRQLCRRIETAVSGYALPIDEHRAASVGVSLGAASFPQNGETFDQLVVAADKAMYRTKESNKKKKQGGGGTGGGGQVGDVGVAARADEPKEVPAVKLQEATETAAEYDGGLVVELDESHVIAASAAVN